MEGGRDGGKGEAMQVREGRREGGREGGRGRKEGGRGREGGREVFSCSSSW